MLLHPSMTKIKFEPSLDEFKSLSKNYNLIPVYTEVLADTLTPISAYVNIVGDEPGFLLESVEGGEKMGRYSFIGLDSWKILYFSGKDPLLEIENYFSALKPYRNPDLPRFIGGAVGFVGYDCISYFEPKVGKTYKKFPKPSLPLPDAAFIVAGKLLVFDSIKRRLILISNAKVNGDPETSYNKAKEELSDLLKKLSYPKNFPVPGSASPPSESQASPIKSSFEREDFISAVKQAKEYILAGDIFQVVLSQRLERNSTATPFEIYRTLRAINPSPYMFYLKFPSHGSFKSFALVGSSPEVMVRIENKKITLRPIAGTRPRGNTAEKDLALEQELLKDEKECAEHIMLVDLGRNDVGRVSEHGSVHVDELMVIERYSHVMHIVSNVTGELSKNQNAFDVIRSAFPAGTVSGAPKIRAMEIIRELEPTGRGPYAGAAGYIGFEGNADTAIILRTILVCDGKAYVQVGAGIVHDSVPELEYEETMNKARAMIKALDWAEAGL